MHIFIISNNNIKFVFTECTFIILDKNLYDTNNDEIGK